MQLPLLRRDTILGLVLSVQYLLTDNQPKPHDNLISNLGVDPCLFEKIIHKEGTSLPELQATRFERIRTAIGDDCRVVLIGDATHGTEELYHVRAELTKALLLYSNFDAVLCEGGLPEFLELNRFVATPSRELPHTSLATNKATSLENALDVFLDRFPTWMWRNDVMQDFCLWLKMFNQARRPELLPVQILGIDIYSLFQSIDEVIHYLKEAGETALENDVTIYYSTLNSFRPEPKDYQMALDFDRVKSQAENVDKVVAALSRQSNRLSRISGNGHELFYALQNARIVAAAESYFRQSYIGAAFSWNLRDKAFLDMINDTMSFIETKKGSKARIVVWAHNSHVGDALATAHQARNVINMGQLCRQQFAKDHVYIIGLTTHEGTVRAARKWGELDGVMKLNPSFEASHEYILHSAAKRRRQNAFCYIFRSKAPQQKAYVDDAARQVFGVDRLERFVGVSYDRGKELQFHYTTCRASEQYDSIIHIDHSTALRVDRVNQYGKWNSYREGGRQKWSTQTKLSPILI
jgi:erythromycin esterase-like protein